MQIGNSPTGQLAQHTTSRTQIRLFEQHYIVGLRSWVAVATNVMVDAASPDRPIQRPCDRRGQLSACSTSRHTGDVRKPWRFRLQVKRRQHVTEKVIMASDSAEATTALPAEPEMTHKQHSTIAADQSAGQAPPADIFAIYWTGGSSKCSSSIQVGDVKSVRAPGASQRRMLRGTSKTESAVCRIAVFVGCQL